MLGKEAFVRIARIVAELPLMPCSVAPDLASRARRAGRILRLLLGASLAFTLAATAGALRSQQSGPEPKQNERAEAKDVRGVQIVEQGGYPELRVDGAPFFIHSAAFFYYRIPRDQWEHLLKEYRSLGINTLDIYIPWNWHEPEAGKFDFDGHTNARRNLRALLALVAREGFKLIARPGPEILNEWKHGGYPGWLLERPEYKMNATDWIEGRYPPLDNLNPRDAEAAARGWLENSTHMDHARRWLTAVSKELAPYSSHRAIQAGTENTAPASRETSGPLLFVQLGDDFAEGRTNRAGADFWRYVESLRGALEAGGVDVPVFINPTDARVAAAGSGLQPPIGVMGQWYMEPRELSEQRQRLLTAEDAAELEFFTEELKTQPAFPPALIEYQAEWYAPGDDDRPPPSPPENTLLSSRLLIANGIHGINYFPLQDTYTPAGYSVPWANRSYRWDAALGPDGDAQPRLAAVKRNAAILRRWGPELAASHKRADFGILYPLAAYPQDLLTHGDISRVSGAVMRLERLGALATLSSELLDPAHQPVEQLLRDSLLLLPVFDSDQTQFRLSDAAQQTIVEYVRRGGTLVFFPAKPAGKVIEQLWKSAPVLPGGGADSAIQARWKFGEGEVIESSKDFFSWVALDRSLSENRAQNGATTSIRALRGFIAAARIEPAVTLSDDAVGAGELIATELVTNEGSGALGERNSGRGFLSLTNLGAEEPAEATLDVLSPAASARAKPRKPLSLHVVVPPRESVLLPLQQPICFADEGSAPCVDEVSAAGAELLDAEREGKTLKLLFYVPARAEAFVRLLEAPARVMIEETRLDVNWDSASKQLKADIPRGAAPLFQRIVKIDLPYKPHVAEAEKPGKPAPADLNFFVANAVRMPTSENAFLRTFPPLVVPDSNRGLIVLLQGENRSKGEAQSADISVAGPLHGNGTLWIPAGGAWIEKIQLKPSPKDVMALTPASDGLLHGTIEIRAGHDRRSLPVAFLQPKEAGTSHYRFDFDRDGADEWVLENASLRLIVSPESGGRAIALTDKSSGMSLTTSVGLLRDHFAFTENPVGINPARVRGKYGLFNRPYAAEWLTEQTNPALKLQYEAPDVFPFGAAIEKTVQFENAATIRVDYRVALNPLKPGAAMPSRLPPQSFVAVNSFPAIKGQEDSTRFCWKEPKAESQPAEAGKVQAGETADRHCEDFVPDGKPNEVPAGVARVEVQTPGRPMLALAWECAETCARMIIEPKTFSALLRLEFPQMVPGAGAVPYTLRIITAGAP